MLHLFNVVGCEIISYKLKISGLLLIIVLIFDPVFATRKEATPKKEFIKWAVQKTSTMRIVGSSNINSFACDMKGYYNTDTIYCFDENDKNKAVALKGALEVEVLSFDCHNKILTSDLRKTLKADEYPKLIIRFLSLERIPCVSTNRDCLNGTVEIELAGSSRRFDINYSFVRKDAGCIQLNGERIFTFSDFKLKAPSKFAGLVKVKDVFDVQFTLLLNAINS
jgi:hypothetical protein